MAGTKNMLLRVKQEARYWQLKAEEYAANATIIKAYTVQQCIDVAQITLHQEFGFGGQRNTEFERAFRSNFAELLQMANEEEADEKALHGKNAFSKLPYSLTKLDDALKDALGGDCLPFTQRHRLSRCIRRAKEMNIRVDMTDAEIDRLERDEIENNLLGRIDEDDQ